jgi:hypothetical protein
MPDGTSTLGLQEIVENFNQGSRNSSRDIAYYYYYYYQSMEESPSRETKVATLGKVDLTFAMKFLYTILITTRYWALFGDT